VTYVYNFTVSMYGLGNSREKLVSVYFAHAVCHAGFTPETPQMRTTCKKLRLAARQIQSGIFKMPIQLPSEDRDKVFDKYIWEKL